MIAKMIWGNVSVHDLSRTREFYTRLGFKANDFSNEPTLVSFNFGYNDVIIHFFQQETQIKDFLPAGAAKGSDIIFTLSADTEQEVNDLAAKVIAAGGNIFRPVLRDEAGYYGFAFTDPDGLKFNVILMDNM